MIYKITDYFGESVQLKPRVELYSVKDFMGTELLGLGIVLDEVGDAPEKSMQYAVLTLSFGEFIGIKNCAYVDTNNCGFAQQLLDQGIAKSTGFHKESGYCRYPLWQFDEDVLKEIGGQNYQKYSDEYDGYMKTMYAPEEPEQDKTEAMNLGGI